MLETGESEISAESVLDPLEEEGIRTFQAVTPSEGPSGTKRGRAASSLLPSTNRPLRKEKQGGRARPNGPIYGGIS
jgi:hypothetical protein